MGIGVFVHADLTIVDGLKGNRISEVGLDLFLFLLYKKNEKGKENIRMIRQKRRFSKRNKKYHVKFHRPTKPNLVSRLWWDTGDQGSTSSP